MVCASINSMDFLTTLYKKWWFWVLFVPLFAWGAWQMYLLIDDWIYQAPFRAQEKELKAGLRAWEAEGARITNLYKKDTYGGATPEETLNLFIKALEAGNYELASKYYIPEQQEGVLREIREAKFLEGYLKILKGEKEGKFFDNAKQYEMNYYQNNRPVNFERLILNEYTNVWKIEDH